MLSHSSNQLRILPMKNRLKIHLDPIRLKTQGDSSFKRSSLVQTSFENCKRIHELNKKLKLNELKFKEEIEENQLKEDKVCQMHIFEKIKDGQFSSVYKVRIKQTGAHLALKKVIVDKQHESRQERICQIIHSNFLVKMIDVYMRKQEERQELNILMELYDWNLKDYIRSDIVVDPLIQKLLFYQMVRSLLYLHSKGICHRDIKPENFLMKKTGRIVLTDFGSAKFIKKQEFSISYMNSRSYRAPELQLGNTQYTLAVDTWALGCVMIQALTKKQIFQGASTIDCLLNIGRILGTKDIKKMNSNEQLTKLLPSLKGIGLLQYLPRTTCPMLIDMLSKMLKINAGDRITPIDILVHPYFDECRDEQVYHQVIKDKINISDFFDFSTNQIKNYEQYKMKLVPVWKRDRPEKRISTTS